MIDKLKALIGGAPFNGNQAAFARAIKRQPAQVNQWLSGHRKLDIKGQKIIEDALGIRGYFEATHQASEPAAPYPVNVVAIPKTEHPDIAAVVAMMAATDDRGRAMALSAVKVALDGYIPAKANPASC